MASATLSKPLSRECLVNLFGELLWKLPGSGLFVSREPHLPRTLQDPLFFVIIKTPPKICQEKNKKLFQKILG